MARKAKPPFDRISKVCQPKNQTEVLKMSSDIKSFAKWNCDYHIVFAPKYRRKIIYGQLRAELGAMLRELCGWKG